MIDPEDRATLLVEAAELHLIAKLAANDKLKERYERRADRLIEIVGRLPDASLRPPSHRA